MLSHSTEHNKVSRYPRTKVDIDLPPGINAVAYITLVIGLRSSSSNPSDKDTSIYGSQTSTIASA